MTYYFNPHPLIDSYNVGDIVYFNNAEFKHSSAYYDNIGSTSYKSTVIKKNKKSITITVSQPSRDGFIISNQTIYNNKKIMPEDVYKIIYHQEALKHNRNLQYLYDEEDYIEEFEEDVSENTPSVNAQ